MSEKTKHVWDGFELIPHPIQKTDENLRTLPFQQFSVYKALNQKAFCFSLPTGAGKTLCSLLTYFYFRLKNPKTKLIILTNPSAILQFASEIYKFFNFTGRTVAIHHKMDKLGAKKYAGSRKNAYQLFAAPFEEIGSIDILVSNYSTFRLDIQHIHNAVLHLRKQGYFIFFITDEATNFKNLKSQTFKCISLISSLSSKTIALTATLTKGKLEEIYAIFKGIGIQITKNKDEFLDRFCIQFKHPTIHYLSKITGYKNLPELTQLIKNYSIIIRKQDIVADLPPFTVKNSFLEHDKRQYTVISDIYRGMFFQEDIDSVGKDKTETYKMVQPLTEIHFIKTALLDARIVTHEGLKVKKHPHDNSKNSYSISDPSIFRKNHSPKTDELLRILKEDFFGEKIIVYTHSKLYLRMLDIALSSDKAIPEYYKNFDIISGDDASISSREEKRLRFQNSKDHNLLLINDAGAESLNLQSAGIIITLSLPRSFGNFIQLLGRISRLKTEHKNLLLINLMMEDSQDLDNYAALMVQSKLLTQVIGESEIGIYDNQFMKDQDLTHLIDEKEFDDKTTVESVILHQRKNRSSFYKEKFQ